MRQVKWTRLTIRHNGDKIHVRADSPIFHAPFFIALRHRDTGPAAGLERGRAVIDRHDCRFCQHLYEAVTGRASSTLKNGSVEASAP